MGTINNLLSEKKLYFFYFLRLFGTVDYNFEQKKFF